MRVERSTNYLYFRAACNQKRCNSYARKGVAIWRHASVAKSRRIWFSGRRHFLLVAVRGDKNGERASLAHRKKSLLRTPAAADARARFIAPVAASSLHRRDSKHMAKTTRASRSPHVKTSPGITGKLDTSTIVDDER
ncbi:hypothetical protein J8I26_19070 [Herbaspirillum sp. LeCh32-8]|uniref:hypothetical protein n=1 Tax=Herbaspirillum sp. LeCh32-8 TaxID=2821356 RepID=UPI001AE4F625|nr:hypothetical protein [Herbaspirillum sp. LeCh32-8]MBP0600220.1 hypothetical protein [Herbaspirillum sp. LeCh32-8]